jgi:hypothetical protein
MKVLLRNGTETIVDLRIAMVLSKKNEHVGLAWEKGWRVHVGRCTCFVLPTSLANAYDEDDAAPGTSTQLHNRCIKEGDQMRISGMARCGLFLFACSMCEDVLILVDDVLILGGLWIMGMCVAYFF